MGVYAGIKHSDCHTFAAEVPGLSDSFSTGAGVCDIEKSLDGPIIINLFNCFMVSDFLNLFRCKMTFDTVDNADFLFEMIVRIHITNLYKFILLTLVTTPFIFDDHGYFLGVGILQESSAAAAQ